MPVKIIINEIHPNQESGSEWIELLIENETAVGFSLNNYTIFDNSKQIYKFTTEEFVDQLLVVELSGLNNDTDSVVLKNNNEEIIDSFTYIQTQKGMSWSRTDPEGNFLLTQPSKNQINPQPTPSPSPSLSQNPSPTLSTTPNPNQTVVSQTPSPSLKESSTEHKTTPINNIQKTENLSKNYIYDLKKIKLEATDSSPSTRSNRLVILSETEGQRDILNAIIGSSLIILSAIFIIYVKFKNRNN